MAALIPIAIHRHPLQDTTEVTAVQAAVLYTWSVAIAAVDFARQAASAAANAIGVDAALTSTTAPPVAAGTTFLTGPLTQLVHRVVALAALHTLLALAGIWLGASRLHRRARAHTGGASGDGGGDGDIELEQSHLLLQGALQLWGKQRHAASAVREGGTGCGQHRLDEGDIAGAAAAAVRRLQRWFVSRSSSGSGRGLVVTGVRRGRKLAAASSRPVEAEGGYAGGGHAGGVCGSGGGGGRMTPPVSAPLAGNCRHQIWEGQARHMQDEQQHEQSSQQQEQQRRLQEGEQWKEGMEEAELPAASARRWSQRPSYFWIVNSVCSWLAGLARAALLVLLAPLAAVPAAGAAAFANAATATGSKATSMLYVDGGIDLQSGEAALTATVVLLAHLIASNLSPWAYGIQSAAAAAAGALLHCRLAPSASLQALVAAYGGLWLAAAALSYHLASSCRKAAASSSQLLYPLRPAAASAVSAAAADADADAVEAVKEQTLASPPLANETSVEASSSRRLVRPPRLGPSFSRVTSTSINNAGDDSSPFITGAGTDFDTDAGSDLIMGSIHLSASPRRSVLGQPAQPRFPTSHSGVTPNPTRVQEALSTRPRLRRTDSVSSQGRVAAGAGVGVGAGTTALTDPQGRFPVAGRAGQPMYGAGTVAAAVPPQQQRLLLPPLAAKRASLDSLPPKPHPAYPVLAGTSEEVTLSHVRRASSERPPSLGRQPVALTPSGAPVSNLQQSQSCGPAQVPFSFARRQSAPDGTAGGGAAAAATTVVAAATPAAAAGFAAGGVVRAGGSVNKVTTANQHAANPATTVWTGAGAPRALHGGGGDIAEPGGTAGPQGAAALQARMLPYAGSLSGVAPGGGAAAAAAAANDHSMLSSVILEADVYDRLLSSASSPFLLNPNSIMRYPSTANTGTIPLPAALASPSSFDWRGTASGAAAAAVAAAVVPTAVTPTVSSFKIPAAHRIVRRGSDAAAAAEEGELQSSETGPRSGGGDGGWARAAPGSRSRLERVTAAAAAIEETMAPPRQVIVLADGRQVYQSDVLAAAASASPHSSSTPLASVERHWAPTAVMGTRDLLHTSMAGSETDALGTGRAAAMGSSLASTTAGAISRHLSYTTRGGGVSGLSGASSAVEPLSSSPASYSPYLQPSGERCDGRQYGDGVGGEVAVRQLSAGAGGRIRQWAAAAQSRSQLQFQLRNAASVGGKATVAAAWPSSMCGGGTAVAGSFSGTAARGGDCASCKSPSYATRGGVTGGVTGGYGTSTSGRISSSYGPASGAGSSGAALTMGGTSGSMSYGTVETGGSLRGGGGGGSRGGGTVSYPRSSLDLGRHLHDTGLIRIGEEEAGLDNDDAYRADSTLFGTCDDGDGGGIDRYPSSIGGYSFCNGSESDRRSSIQERRSNATASGDLQHSRRAAAAVPPSYCSSSVGSGAVGDITGSVPLVTMTTAVAAGQQGLMSRVRPRSGRGISHRQKQQLQAPTLMSGGGGGSAAAVTSASGSSWSAYGTRSSVDVPHAALSAGAAGDGGSSTGPLGSGAIAGVGNGSGRASLAEAHQQHQQQHPRGLADSSAHPSPLENHQTAASATPSNGPLPQLHGMKGMDAAVVTAAAAIATAPRGSGSGSSAAAAAAAVAIGGASVVGSGRYLASGGSYRSSQNNSSLLSFTDVTVGCHVAPPAGTVAGAPAATSSHIRCQSSATAATATDTASGGAIVVTLMRGIVVNTPQNSSGGAVDNDTVSVAPAMAAAVLGTATAAAAAAAITVVSHGSSTTSEGGKGAASLRFLAYPQTLAPMLGSGSTGRGSQAALRALGGAGAVPALGSGAAIRGSNGTAVPSSSGRLGFAAATAAGGAGGGGEPRMPSRPTLPELLASTAAVAAALGNTPGYGGGTAAGPAASPWVSPALSAPLRDVMSASPQFAAAPQLPLPLPPPGQTGAGAASTSNRRGMGRQASFKSYRVILDLFRHDDGGSGGGGGGLSDFSAAAVGRDASCSTGCSHRTAETAGSAGGASAVATPSQPLSQTLGAARRLGMSWFGQILATKRSSIMGVSGGGGGLLASPPPSSQLAPPGQSEHLTNYNGAASCGPGGSGVGEVQALDGRVSAASGGGAAAAAAATTGRSSQQLTRLMDDTARLSPVQGVLRGLRKRFRGGKKSLTSGSGARE
ncbi:hypothetical protein VOLCADRAFT_92138 [Volvox carteri f. nagariensis]|uniref:Uncharacterized protein n=1 Tax=Volvox carteri f. nagariensis TaxID=3068 RepID=D8TYQ0_VOLCA|nr:uncharacterized protein VOLCADRAFT_92138 [Volvox carteri f. nagariensis]EFJ47350.1 hypothetical protein VOLCADRAFT_92138 [Volvox carteri f. nagariensis]|eukprot:XP_002951539.1 hypothetical protein VOLCADRAFT_92138 [Volvox carteri f. nagariensis]